MRIFAAVRHSTDPCFYYGGLWSGNFYPALRQLGHQIIESEVDLLPVSRFMHIGSNFTPQESEARARVTSQILAEVLAAHKEHPIDLFLSYFYNAHFDSSGFDQLRKLGIPSVNFYCNSIYQFEHVREIAARVDFAWHAERDARQLYLNVGANPVRVQMGADPDVYRPVNKIQPQNRSCFVGQRYADRDRWMASLIRANIPVDIYGPGWGDAGNRSESNRDHGFSEYLGRPQHQPASRSSYVEALRGMISKQGVVGGIGRGVNQWRYRAETRRLAPIFLSLAKGAISFDKIAEVFAAYEVCLNFSNVWADGRPGSTLIPHIRLRDFEAPMCRTCYLTGHTDEIGEFYEVGTEIDTYSTADELIDKMRFYLARPDAAEKLREKGYRRAVRDHTWINRFRELFYKIGLTNDS